jgi:hypothetical protein
MIDIVRIVRTVLNIQKHPRTIHETPTTRPMLETPANSCNTPDACKLEAATFFFSLIFTFLSIAISPLSSLHCHIYIVTSTLSSTCPSPLHMHLQCVFNASSMRLQSIFNLLFNTRFSLFAAALRRRWQPTLEIGPDDGPQIGPLPSSPWRCLRLINHMQADYMTGNHGS